MVDKRMILDSIVKSGTKSRTKLWLVCVAGALLWSGSSHALVVNETTMVSQLQAGLTNIQIGTLFLCETQNLRSPRVVVRIAAPQSLRVMRSSSTN
jgi:hypothetical protein